MCVKCQVPIVHNQGGDVDREDICRPEPQFSVGGDLAPRAYLARSRDIFGHHKDGGGRLLLLASSWWRPRMLLNILQCTRQPPPQQKIIWPKRPIVLRWRKPGLEPPKINL